MSRVLGLLTVIVLTMTIGTTPVLAEYPEGCKSVEEGATSLYHKAGNSNPTEYWGTFCRRLTCDLTAQMWTEYFGKGSVYWCE